MVPLSFVVLLYDALGLGVHMGKARYTFFQQTNKKKDRQTFLSTTAMSFCLSRSEVNVLIRPKIASCGQNVRPHIYAY